MSRVRFVSRVECPDGLVIEVACSADERRPDVGELGELAQMVAGRGWSLVKSNAEHAARHREQLEREERGRVAPF